MEKIAPHIEDPQLGKPIVFSKPERGTSCSTCNTEDLTVLVYMDTVVPTNTQVWESCINGCHFIQIPLKE